MLRTRLLSYLLSLLLPPLLLACADHDEAQPSIGYYDAYAPRLTARATLEEFGDGAAAPAAARHRQNLRAGPLPVHR